MRERRLKSHLVSLLSAALFAMPVVSNAAGDLALPYLPCQLSLTHRIEILPLMSHKVLPPPGLPYVRVHQRPNAVSGGDLSVVVFPSGTYRPLYEEQLRQAGYFAIVIENPTAGEVISNPDFLYGPQSNFWLQPSYLDNEVNIAAMFPDKKQAKAVSEWAAGTDPELVSWILNAAPLSKERSDIVRRLRNMEAFRTEVAPLTLGDYDLWNERIFQPEVAKKLGGMMIWPAKGSDLLKQMGLEVVDASVPYENQQVKGYYRVFYRDEKGELAAGAILFHEVFTNHLGQPESRIVVRAAVYNEASRQAGAATKTIAEALKLIRGLGRPFLATTPNGIVNLSYGTDPNLYIFREVDPALQTFKTSMGFTAVPKRVGDTVPTQLFKLINTSLSQIDDRASGASSAAPSVVFYSFRDRLWSPGGDDSIQLNVLKPQSGGP